MANGGNGRERPYHPKSKAEGVEFMARYCLQCVHHELYALTEVWEDECLILRRSVMNRPGDILYPPEWTTTDGTIAGADCSAFEPAP